MLLDRRVPPLRDGARGHLGLARGAREALRVAGHLGLGLRLDEGVRQVVRHQEALVPDELLDAGADGLDDVAFQRLVVLAQVLDGLGEGTGLLLEVGHITEQANDEVLDPRVRLEARVGLLELGNVEGFPTDAVDQQTLGVNRDHQVALRLGEFAPNRIEAAGRVETALRDSALQALANVREIRPNPVEGRGHLAGGEHERDGGGRSEVGLGQAHLVEQRNLELRRELALEATRNRTLLIAERGENLAAVLDECLETLLRLRARRQHEGDDGLHPVGGESDVVEVFAHSNISLTAEKERTAKPPKAEMPPS